MKRILLTIIATVAAVTTYSQKLPNKQETSLKAPVDVKIDGKPNEWGGFKAYNPATGLLYIIANDDQNLYLITQTKIPGIRDKVWAGGISLIFTKATGTDKNNMVSSLTYSAMPTDRRGIVGSVMNDTPDDINSINSAIAGAIKTIGIKNFEGINEEAMSIYNEYGITAASYLADKNTYTCEMAIPLKYIKSFISVASVINYTLQVNALQFGNVKVNMNGREVDGNSVAPRLLEMINNSNAQEVTSPGGIPMKEWVNDTNVSGEYTLAN